MNDCHMFRELIAEYLDGTIDDGRLGRLKAHADTCASCAREFKRVTLMRHVVTDAFLPGMAAEQVKTAILTNLRERPDRQPLEAHAGGIRWFHVRLAVAAGFLLGVGAIAGFALGTSRSSQSVDASPLTLVSMRVAGLEGTILVRHDGSHLWNTLMPDSAVYLGDTFHSTGGSRLTLALSEESTVQVGENSILVLTSYNGETRLYLEHGHCRASLQSPHPPFFIDTPHGRAEALGTVFTVTVK